jgi:hypothetical protein
MTTKNFKTAAKRKNQTKCFQLELPFTSIMKNKNSRAVKKRFNTQGWLLFFGGITTLCRELIRLVEEILKLSNH